MSRSLEVIGAVVHRAHGWRHARNPSNAVTSSLRRHHVVRSGDYPRDVRSSWRFACQPGMDLSAYVHFHYLP
eukprot:11130923-Alexandrium_andersonii.AAC.1